MTPSELKRLIKIEDILYGYARDVGLEFCDIEWDVVPDQKMLEIMAYHIPGNISSWKYGREYERLRTINEHHHAGLPYEVVINSDPSRAYLMKSNTFGVQALVMAHVIGHVAFFTMNKYFQQSRRDIIQVMSMASERFNEYERIYGIDAIERVVDAGHALMFHSSPFEDPPEEERRKQIYEQEKRKAHGVTKSKFRDLIDDTQERLAAGKQVELYNQKLWRRLMQKTPVEPTEDILHYIYNNSSQLEDWEIDVLQILRQQGQYYYPAVRTKYMNEGFATYWHEIFIDRLFREGHLTTQEHAEYNYANSLVKAMNPKSLNPYLIGCSMWQDIVKRWNMGRHGREWEHCDDWQTKEDWDTGDMAGHEKMLDTVKSYTDWFFMKEFMTPELVDDLELYIFVVQEHTDRYDLVRTKHTAKEICELIISSFAHSGIPKIEIVDGNAGNARVLRLEHRWSGADLDIKYAEETLKHIYRMWGNTVVLKTKINQKDVDFVVRSGNFSIPSMEENKKPQHPNIWSTLQPVNPLKSNNYLMI